MADFFGFNPQTDFEHELHDDPGDGLDEDPDDYDALNDETFGADSMGGDWEQSHEEMAQITESSRVHRDSTGSLATTTTVVTEERTTRDYLLLLEGGDVGNHVEAIDDEDIGLDNLDLEASLTQLVDDGDDEKIGRGNQQRSSVPHRVLSHRVMESGYSCSPPSEFNVWAVNRHDQVVQQQQQLQQQAVVQMAPPTPKILKVHTLEELERDLRAQPTSVFPARGGTTPQRSATPLRLEDLERDLTASKQQAPLLQHKLPPGFPPPQQQIQQRAPYHPQHMQQDHSNGVPPPGYAHRLPPPGAGRYLPQATQQQQPGMMDFRHQQHGHRHMGPNMLRFMPPHPLMAGQQYQQHRNHPNFRHPYPMPPPGMDPRLYPPHYRPPYPRPPGPPRYPPPPGGRMNGYHPHGLDEYDGLMNEREVKWLLNIQMLQLNTTQPFKDDFYYTVYQSRKPKNRPDARNGRERRDSNRDNWPEQAQPRVYTPLQFENSLGKLQCGSVTTPRKIIDMDVVSEQPADTTQAQQKDSRRAKQLLLQLEQLYLLLMQVEDADNPLAEPAEVDTPALVAKICTTLLAEDRLQATLCVGKGKNLVLRLLPYLTSPEHDEHHTVLWSCLLKNLIPVGRRDAEADCLARLYPHMERWVRAQEGTERLQRLATAMRVTTPYPPSRNLLVYALAHKFGVSALTTLMSRAESLLPPDPATPHSDWSTLAIDLLDAAPLVDLDRQVAPLRRDPDARGSIERFLCRCAPSADRDKLASLMTLLTTGGGEGAAD